MATEENRRWALDFVRAHDIAYQHMRGGDPLVGTVMAAELLVRWLEGKSAASVFPDGAMPGGCKTTPLLPVAL